MPVSRSVRGAPSASFSKALTVNASIQLRALPTSSFRRSLASLPCPLMSPWRMTSGCLRAMDLLLVLLISYLHDRATLGVPHRCPPPGGAAPPLHRSGGQLPRYTLAAPATSVISPNRREGRRPAD